MKKGWKIFWHTLFWLSTTAGLMFLAHGAETIPLRTLLVAFGVFGIVNISLFYVSYLVLLPRHFGKRNKSYLMFFVNVIICLVVVGVIKYAITHQFWEVLHPVMKNNKVTPREHLMFFTYVFRSFFTSIIFILFSLILRFTEDWFSNERVQRNLENERLTAELAFLKSQINPHFLFNSLNSIYSLAYQKSETTPDAILKLSEIMRYMLYECNDNKVDLSKEITYLQNYIDLQKIRFGKNAYVELEVNGQVTTQRIVPLLLIPFIENAFKHGVANDPERPIKMIINVAEKHLSFYMENKKHLMNRDSIGGIGLTNVRRRLDLLYPGNYTLEIHDDADTYTCELSLIL